VTVETAWGPRVFRARRGILISTGTEPALPPVPGLADTPYWTNREAIETEQVPESLIVLGGGAVGAELAQVFARFGARVTVVEAMVRLLPAEEPEAGQLLATVLTREGLTVRIAAHAEQVSHDGQRFTSALAGGEMLTAQRLLVATGRRADLAGLGLRAYGVGDTAGTLATDERMRAAAGLWAVGDITGKGGFTHVSMYQAAIAVADILGQDGPAADYRAVPRVTFTDPELAHVGLSEADARRARLNFRVLRWPFHENDRAQTERDTHGHIKVITSRGGRILGATIVGPSAGELITTWTLAIGRRFNVGTLAGIIVPYPTLAEVGKRAAITYFMLGLTRAWVQRIIAWLRWFG
jgi:pyruvate/2-oxoglutarate dehydrogenase complex dihydrolipoamide dehydrogenase (E3) component